MSEGQTQAMSLKAAYQFGDDHGLQKEVRDIRDMVIEWDLSYTSTLRRGYIVALFESNNLFDEFRLAHWSFGLTPAGESKRKLYLRVKARYEAFLAGDSSEPQADGGSDDDQEVDPVQTLEFAMEAHLRDFLARNLDLIEPGLQLYTSAERSGVEYPVEGGRIDLLAIDRSGRPVVIELKLSQGRSRVLGQLLYYMGWIDQHLGRGSCRGVIIASEIRDDLAVAVSRVPGVRLAKYRMSFAIDSVEGLDGPHASS